MSVLIVSTVLVVTVVSLAQFGVASRFFLLDFEKKTLSAQLASGCAHMGRVYIYQQHDITESGIPEVTPHAQGTLPIGDTGTCTFVDIAPDTPATGVSRMEIVAEYKDATTRLEVDVEHTSGDFTRWVEI